MYICLFACLFTFISSHLKFTFDCVGDITVCMRAGHDVGSNTCTLLWQFNSINSTGVQTELNWFSHQMILKWKDWMAVSFKMQNRTGHWYSRINVLQNMSVIMHILTRAGYNIYSFSNYNHKTTFSIWNLFNKWKRWVCLKL